MRGILSKSSHHCKHIIVAKETFLIEGQQILLSCIYLCLSVLLCFIHASPQNY